MVKVFKPKETLSWSRQGGGGTHVRDGLLGLLLGVPALLHCLLHFTLKLGQVCLHLLLLVDEAGVLDKGKENYRMYALLPDSTLLPREN